MTLLQFLQLQPIDPQEDGSVSELDTFQEDDTIDLSNDTDGDSLEQAWDKMTQDIHEDDKQQWYI